MREIALDTETTGLDPEAGHRIVEIGCVEMHGRIRTGRHFHIYLDPERDMPEEAQRIHGLSREFLTGKPRFREVAADFLAFIHDSPLVIHNAAFDMKFLNWELQQAGHPMLRMEQSLCSVTLARQTFPGSPASLDALCRRFEIDTSARTLHGALLDAELLADVYLELTGGRQSGLSLETTRSMAHYAARSLLPARHFPPSDAELAAHHDFLSLLSDPLWLKCV